MNKEPTFMSYNSVKLNTVSVDINFADLLENEFITITLHIYNTKKCKLITLDCKLCDVQWDASRVL